MKTAIIRHQSLAQSFGWLDFSVERYYVEGMAKRKATHQTDRDSLTDFEEIINVGAATAGDFRQLGFRSPQELKGQDPAELYTRLCQLTQTRHDPCVLDVLMASIDYMNGQPPQAWWKYTAQRKATYQQLYEE